MTSSKNVFESSTFVSEVVTLTTTESEKIVFISAMIRFEPDIAIVVPGDVGNEKVNGQVVSNDVG